jgi:glutamate/tyrosine decarboxylase-like PLP-dependent enzyme
LPAAPTVPHRTYAQCLADFSTPVPETGEDWTTILEELEAKSKDAMIMQTSPRFFGWVMGASHPAGVAAEFFTAASGQMIAYPLASSANSAIETVVEGWILDLLDLPRQSSIGFVSGAAVANFTCLAAARGEVLRRAGWDADAEGLFGAPAITVLIGDDAHSTVFMALQFAGLGHKRVVRVATDNQGRMLQAALAAELAKVSGPCIVILQAGQINSGDFDPLAELVPMAQAAGAWVHVDGAFGLRARAAPSL